MSRRDRLNIKIVTINITEEQRNYIDNMIEKDNYGLYPSRSELIRVAVRDRIIKEINLSNNLKSEAKIEEYDHNKYVKVPVRELKTYKIIKKLENNKDIRKYRKKDELILGNPYWPKDKVKEAVNKLKNILEEVDVNEL